MKKKRLETYRQAEHRSTDRVQLPGLSGKDAGTDGESGKSDDDNPDPPLQLDAEIIHEVRRRLRHLGCHEDFIHILQSLNDGLTSEDVIQMLKSFNDSENLPETLVGGVVYFRVTGSKAV